MRSAQDVLDRHFLEVRCKLLDIAAVLDRIDRVEAVQDRRRQAIDLALGILASAAENRAEEVQLLLSRPYDPAWLETFEPVPVDPETPNGTER